MSKKEIPTIAKFFKLAFKEIDEIESDFLKVFVAYDKRLKKLEKAAAKK